MAEGGPGAEPGGRIGSPASAACFRPPPEGGAPWLAGHRLGVSLAAGQREAVRSALASKVLVITGGPGVGKTTLVNAILRILQAKAVRVALAAPTGRAAKR